MWRLAWGENVRKSCKHIGLHKERAPYFSMKTNREVLSLTETPAPQNT